MNKNIEIRLDSLSKSFGGVTAVKDVNLLHSQGGVIGLIGPNGAGKTTLFNMLSGVIRPTSGTIALNGRDVTALRPDRMNRAGVSRTFQNLQVFESLTVVENVLVAREQFFTQGPLRAMLGGGRKESRKHEEIARELLHQVNISQYAEKPVGSLSYGLQRRVEIARALASEPQLVLLDEPLAGLSRAESVDLTELMRAVADSGITILLVEHDVSSVIAVSNRVLVLNVGQVLADGTPVEVQRDPRVRTAYLGDEIDEDDRL